MLRNRPSSRATFGLSGLFGVFGLLAAGCAEQAEEGCTAPGTICTFAGTGQAAFDGDGRDRRDTSFYWPMDLSFAPDGRAYLLDWNNHRVRRLGADDRFETVVGSDLPGDGPRDQGDLKPEGAPGLSVELNHPTDIDFLPDGTVLLAAWHNHKVRRLDPASGRVTVTCGAGPGSRGDDGPAVRAALNQPKSIVVDPAGNVFVADSRNQRIRRIDATTGIITTVAGRGLPVGFEGDGGPPLGAKFFMQADEDDNPEPGGSIALDRQGRLYVADTHNHRIRRIDLGRGVVETVAGNGTAGFGGDGGAATAAALNNPRDVELGPDDKLYIADTDNHRVRVVDLATGVITTIAGTGRQHFGGDGGPAASAHLARPFGIAFDAGGTLYVADTFNNRIRKVVR